MASVLGQGSLQMTDDLVTDYARLVLAAGGVGGGKDTVAPEPLPSLMGRAGGEQTPKAFRSMAAGWLQYNRFTQLSPVWQAVRSGSSLDYESARRVTLSLVTDLAGFERATRLAVSELDAGQRATAALVIDEWRNKLTDPEHLVEIADAAVRSDADAPEFDSPSIDGAVVAEVMRGLIADLSLPTLARGMSAAD